jgi:hypothetical protein
MATQRGGFDPNNLTARQIGVILLVLIAGVWGWVSMMSSPSASAQAAAAEPPPPEHSKLDAWVMAEQFVKDALKSPGTAEFGGVFKGDYQRPDDHVEDLGSAHYVARGWVDAQNSFGAKVRADFVVKLHYVGDKKWSLDAPVSLVQRE